MNENDELLQMQPAQVWYKLTSAILFPLFKPKIKISYQNKKLSKETTVLSAVVCVYFF